MVSVPDREHVVNRKGRGDFRLARSPGEDSMSPAALDGREGVTIDEQVAQRVGCGKAVSTRSERWDAPVFHPSRYMSRIRSTTATPEPRMSTPSSRL